MQDGIALMGLALIGLAILEMALLQEWVLIIDGAASFEL